MLKCADSSFYIGSATGEDVSKRVDGHNAGAYPGYTFSRRPVLLLWSEYFDRITDGIAAERQLKGWSRAKKEALIRGEWDRFPWLAKRPGGRARVLSKNTIAHTGLQPQSACFEARPDGLAPQHEESGACRELPSPHAEVRAQRASKHAPLHRERGEAR